MRKTFSTIRDSTFQVYRRQWAMIHLEQQWMENGERSRETFAQACYDARYQQSRGDTVIVRGGLRLFTKARHIRNV